MANLFYIIPCGGAKLDTAAPARSLYTGSSFKLALAAAEAECRDMGGEVLILSALHGLVQLDTVLEPYDVKMGDEGSVTRERILKQAIALGMATEDTVDVYAFLPKAYFAALDGALREIYVYAQDVYEADRGIGEQRHTCVVVRETPPLPEHMKVTPKRDVKMSDLPKNGTVTVRVSDNVMDDDQWSISKVKFEGGRVVAVEAMHDGVYGPAEFLKGMNRQAVLDWLAYDGTGTHPEQYNELVTVIGVEAKPSLAQLADEDPAQLVARLADV